MWVMTVIMEKLQLECNHFMQDCTIQSQRLKFRHITGEVAQLQSSLLAADGQMVRSPGGAARSL